MATPADAHPDGGHKSAEPENLEGVMDRLVAQTDGHVRVHDILAAFDRRVVGPVILVLALLLLTPLGGLPGVPTAVGLLLVLVAVQQLFGRAYPWFPRQLRERGVDHARLQSALERARPWARRIDRFLKPRVTALASAPMSHANIILVILLGALMPPLELIPFAVVVPALAVLLLGLGITARDGIVIAAGWAAGGGAVALAAWVLLSP
jgi:hypothetical protein